jgi:hypothetical protein
LERRYLLAADLVNLDVSFKEGLLDIRANNYEDIIVTAGGENTSLVKINGRDPSFGPLAADQVRSIRAIGGQFSYIDLSDARRDKDAFSLLGRTVESEPDDSWGLHDQPIDYWLDQIYSDPAARSEGLSWPEKVERLEALIQSQPATVRQAPVVGHYDHFSAGPVAADSAMLDEPGIAAVSSGDEGGIVDIIGPVEQPEYVDWMTFTVDHRADPAVDGLAFNGMTVDFSISDGTAVSPDDYDPQALPMEPLEWLDGEEGQNRTISIDIAQDNIWEEDEDLQVTLNGIQNFNGDEGNARLGVSQATGVILNDDPFPTVSIEPSVFVNEDEGPAVLNVRLSNPSYHAITVNWTTQDEAAISDQDYSGGGGAVTFPAESIEDQQITISITDDGVPETNESFVVQLTGATNAEIGPSPYDRGRVTIVDEDGGFSGVVKSQRIAPVAIAEDLFTVKSGEYYDAGNGSEFRFEFEGTVPIGSPLRYELLDTDANFLLSSGAGSSFDYAFSDSINSPDLGWAYVKFYIDANSSGSSNLGELFINSPAFEVVKWASHTLTFEVSNLIPASQIPATVAGRTAWAQQLADGELSVVQKRQHEDDWRSPIVLTMVPVGNGQFIVNPATRPDQGAYYDVDLHLNATPDVTFTFLNVWCGWPTIQAEGCSRSGVGSAVVFDATQYTFIHEIGHFYGSWHTPPFASWNDYLMIKGGQGFTGSRELLRFGDAVNFYNGS